MRGPVRSAGFADKTYIEKTNDKQSLVMYFMQVARTSKLGSAAV